MNKSSVFFLSELNYILKKKSCFYFDLNTCFSSVLWSHALPTREPILKGASEGVILYMCLLSANVYNGEVELLI